MPIDAVTGLVFAAMGIGFAVLALAMIFLLCFIGIRWILQVVYEVKEGNKKGGKNGGNKRQSGKKGR